MYKKYSVGLNFLSSSSLAFSFLFAQISVGLDLHSIKDRAWQIQACSAKKSEGLQEGMEWLIKTVQERESEKK